MDRRLQRLAVIAFNAASGDAAYLAKPIARATRMDLIPKIALVGAAMGAAVVATLKEPAYYKIGIGLTALTAALTTIEAMQFGRDLPLLRQARAEFGQFAQAIALQVLQEAATSGGTQADIDRHKDLVRQHLVGYLWLRDKWKMFLGDGHAQLNSIAVANVRRP